MNEEKNKKYQIFNIKTLNSRFHNACCNGSLPIIEYLLTSPELKQNVDIHHEHDFVFRRACRDGHLDIIIFLLTSPKLKEHADIHVNNDIAFRTACEYGQLEIVEYLLTSPELKDHANIWAENKYGINGIHLAQTNGHQKIIQYLMFYTLEKELPKKSNYQKIKI